MAVPVSVVAVLAAGLLVGGCVAVPRDEPRRPGAVSAAADVRTSAPGPSTVRPDGRPTGRAALVSTGPTPSALRTPRPRKAAPDVSPRKPAAHEAPEPNRRRAGRPAPGPAPAPGTPRRRSGPSRTAQSPYTDYDLRTVCGWSHQAPVSPSVRQLCDTYVR
ncbi:hypothetical protein ABZ330_23700 [Streptomyces sp. NPDC006172]|uniref:hypothetical protein n=1 Tax=Streptomyces sp. NPDC006172 TaxID=3154470 RepID=UPI0033C00CCD